MAKDITEKWRDYAGKVLPDVPPDIKWTCELSFLAGAQAMIKTLTDFVSEHDSFDECSTWFERQQELISKRSNEILSD